MKFTIKVPMLIGLVVFFTSASITITLDIIVKRKLERANFNELYSEARANAEHISTKLTGDLNQLWEIANRARTRTMDWEGVVRQNLLPDIERIGVLELGLIFPDGTYYTASDNAVAYLGYQGDRDYFFRAFAGADNPLEPAAVEIGHVY